MNIDFHLEKHNQHFPVTAFPKIAGNFLQEDIVQYKDNIDDVTGKLLLLENADFELSQNNKLVIAKIFVYKHCLCYLNIQNVKQ